MASLFRSYRLFYTLSSATRNYQMHHLRNFFNAPAMLAVHPMPEMTKANENIPNDLFMSIESKLKLNMKLHRRDIEELCLFIKNHDVSPTQLTFLLKCGLNVDFDMTEQNMEYTINVWKQAKEKGIKLDVSHYNLYMNIHLENEVQFSPEEMIKSMNENNIEPNRVSYQYFIASYCQQGNLESALTVLEEMKNKSLSLNENVFNNLVFGHCVAKNYDGAFRIIKIMEEKGLDIDDKTHTMLLCGFARSGNLTAFQQEFQDRKAQLNRAQIFKIICNLSLGGLNQEALNIYKEYFNPESNRVYTRLTGRLFQQRNMTLITELTKYVCNNEYEIYIKLKQVFQHLGLHSDIDVIKSFADFITKTDLNINPYAHVLVYTLLNKNLDKSLEIIREMASAGFTINEHYFWPAIVHLVKLKDINKLSEIVGIMLYTYNIDIKSSCYSNLFFDNYSSNRHEDVIDLINSLILAGGRKSMIWSGYLLSCLKQGNLDYWADSIDTHLPISFLVIREPLLHSIITVENKTIPIELFYKWIFLKLQEINFRSKTDDPNKKIEDPYGAVQHYVDWIVRNLNNRLTCDKADVMKKILGAMILKGLRISKYVSDEIKVKWHDDELSDLANQHADIEFDGNEALRKADLATKTFAERNSGEFVEFRYLLKNGNIEKAEEIFKRNELLSGSPYFCTMLIAACKQAKNEDKLTYYLDEFVKKFPVSPSLLVETELIDRGRFMEAITLLENKLPAKASMRRIMMNTIKPIFEKGTVEDIIRLINNNGEKTQTLVNFSDILSFFDVRSFEKIKEFLNKVQTKVPNALDISYHLLPKLVNMERYDLIKDLITILKERFGVKSVADDLLLCYACVGDIKGGRELMSSNVVNLKWHVRLDNISNGTKILENLIEIVKGSNIVDQEFLYDHLLKLYIENGDSAEKVTELWVKMQEHNVKASDRFLYDLGSYLKKLEKPIPFEIPQNISRYSESVNASANIFLKTLPPNVMQTLRVKDFDDYFNRMNRHVRKGELTLMQIRKLPEILQLTGNDSSLSQMCRRYIFQRAWYAAFKKNQLWKEICDRSKMSNPPESVVFGIFPTKMISKYILLNEPNLNVSDNTAILVIWAYLRSIGKSPELADLLDNKVRNLVQNESEILNFLSTIEQCPHQAKLLNYVMARSDTVRSNAVERRIEQLQNMSVSTMKGKSDDYELVSKSDETQTQKVYETQPQSI